MTRRKDPAPYGAGGFRERRDRSRDSSDNIRRDDPKRDYEYNAQGFRVRKNRPRDELDNIIPKRREPMPFGRRPVLDPNTGTERPLGEGRLLAEFTVKEVGHDCLICTDDGDGDYELIVAKTWRARKTSFNGLTFPGSDGTDVGYASVSLDVRTATDEAAAETEETLTPFYFVGEKILCMFVATSGQIDVVVENELTALTANTYQADWAEVGMREWAPEVAEKQEGLWYWSSGQVIADDTLTEEVDWTSATEFWNTGGFTKSGSDFTAGADLDGKIVMIGVMIGLLEDPAAPGWWDSNAMVRVSLYQNSSREVSSGIPGGGTDFPGASSSDRIHNICAQVPMELSEGDVVTARVWSDSNNGGGGGFEPEIDFAQFWYHYS